MKTKSGFYDSIEDFQTFEDYLTKNQTVDLFCRLEEFIRYDDFNTKIDNIIDLKFIHEIGNCFNLPSRIITITL